MKTEKKLRKYIIPNIFAMAGTSCYILADTYFISAAAGADGIAAMNLTLPVYGLLFAIGSMIGIGSATRYSIGKALGHKDTFSYFSNAVMWSIITGLIFCVIAIVCPDKVLRIMGADTALLCIGTPYLQIVLLFAPFFISNYTFTAFVRNDGSPKTAMTATLLSSLFNIVFDYIFMFPLGMGMKGAALATGLSPVISIIICMTHYLSKNSTITFKMMPPSPKLLIQSCSLGTAAFVGEIAGGITTLVFNFILLDIAGNTGVAAYGIVANMAFVCISIFNGISQGLQPMASEAHGKSDISTEKKILNHSMLIGIIAACTMVIFVLLNTKTCVQIFNSENSETMAAYAVTGIRLYFPGFLIAGVNIILTGFLSATGRAVQSSVIAFSRGIAAIIISAITLSSLFGMTGVWLAFPVAEIFTLLLYITSVFLQSGIHH